MTLPKPPTLGSANQVIGVKKAKAPAKDSKYADCIASKMDGIMQRIVAFYSDGMALIWDMSSKDKPRVMRAFLSHNGQINDLEILPDSTIEITKFAT